jgi:hypothetical protein
MNEAARARVQVERNHPVGLHTDKDLDGSRIGTTPPMLRRSGIRLAAVVGASAWRMVGSPFPGQQSVSRSAAS